MGTKPTPRQILLRQKLNHQKALDEAIRQRQEIATELAKAQAEVSAAAARLKEVDEVLEAIGVEEPMTFTAEPSAGTAIMTASVSMPADLKPEPTASGLIATFDEQDDDETPPKGEDR